MAGNSLIDLRRQYMQLVGSPIVPSKSYFGFQHSLFGFKSFKEIQLNIDQIRSAGIQQDGAVLDLYWFGGQKERFKDGDPRNTRFGDLEWDSNAFLNPSLNIDKIKYTNGVGITLIEEPYIGLNTKMHKMLEMNGGLVKDCKTCSPTIVDYNPWWGVGGLVDWTSPNSSLWHDCKRCALIKGCSLDTIKCVALVQSNFSAEIAGHWVHFF